jgi:2-C-methyl-D-erythritol 2,4-cyclodiphosphate synthase
MDSQDILRLAVAEAKKRGYRVGNVDIAVIAEKPKLAPHIAKMKARLATTLGVTVEDVGLKATTNEGCDTIGAGQAIAAHAVVLLVKAE